MIRLAKMSDIDDLAIIYKDLYDNANIGEIWTIEKSKELLLYWYKKQSDLFFVAEENGKPVGAIVSGIKSWFDGLRLVDTEIFVSQKCQKKHIGRDLMLEHLKQAKIKYNAKVIEFHTYGNEEDFSQNWYKRIGFKKDQELVIMNANIEMVLNKLGYVSNGKIHNTTSDIVNIGYKELSLLYSKLKQGDTVYIFDMIPEYSYKDNKEEKEYIESRITAMKNGADVSLFIIGNKAKITKLSSNELFNYAISSCYGNSKIYVIDEDKLKQKCPTEYFQLANGLYYCERKDGSKEIFRDLWIDSNNIGLFIKDKSIISYIEESIENIVEKIKNYEINYQ